MKEPKSELAKKLKVVLENMTDKQFKKEWEQLTYKPKFYKMKYLLLFLFGFLFITSSIIILVLELNIYVELLIIVCLLGALYAFRKDIDNER